ncbi:amidohydrolase [Leucobacter exalbidus]|uniref:Amidohydrolase n=1 Tax=Leucobacter exalbidus TaxID=662960 RepID=A0A940T3N9_9MICO|nr:M20 family metallopeptidase [Leucobacter exalbidus]MBP1326013.1 amidohydrolase [Leucobacter exalbidus]
MMNDDATPTELIPTAPTDAESNGTEVASAAATGTAATGTAETGTAATGTAATGAEVNGTEAARALLARTLLKRTTEHAVAASLLREELHQHPHISGEEEPTAAWIAERMPTEMQRVADVGRIGRIGPDAGPAIAVRSELDALPIIERTGATFGSTNGAMHACGHDVHQAALIALSRAAAECELPYALVPFLQPREEAYPSGALDIVGAGVLAEQGVAAVLAAHVHPGIARGAVATGKGPTNAAADEVHVTVHGRGGHGAYPHEAANPIGVLAQIVVGLPAVVARTVSPMHPAVLTVGRFTAGDAANVIPAEAHAAATLRTMDRGDRPKIHEALRTYVEAQAASFGVTAEVTITTGEPVLENDPDLVDRVDDQLRHAGFIVSEPMRSCGADDFSFYSEQIPGVMAFVGVETEGATLQPSLHHAQFLPDADAVRRVALALAAAYLGACDELDQRASIAGAHV